MYNEFWSGSETCPDQAVSAGLGFNCMCNADVVWSVTDTIPTFSILLMVSFLSTHLLFVPIAGRKGDMDMDFNRSILLYPISGLMYSAPFWGILGMLPGDPNTGLGPGGRLSPSQGYTTYHSLSRFV